MWVKSKFSKNLKRLLSNIVWDIKKPSHTPLKGFKTRT
jgi:hypothetical protein